MTAEERLDALEARNKRVEAEKAWETSWLRAISIAALTYIAAAALLWIINASNPWTGALVPPLGFLLSTQSLPAVKRWWIARHHG